MTKPAEQQKELIKAASRRQTGRAKSVCALFDSSWPMLRAQIGIRQVAGIHFQDNIVEFHWGGLLRCNFPPRTPGKKDVTDVSCYGIHLAMIAFGEAFP
jgi:hypothetical protein